MAMGGGTGWVRGLWCTPSRPHAGKDATVQLRTRALDPNHMAHELVAGWGRCGLGRGGEMFQQA